MITFQSLIVVCFSENPKESMVTLACLIRPYIRSTDYMYNLTLGTLPARANEPCPMSPIGGTSKDLGMV